MITFDNPSAILRRREDIRANLIEKWCTERLLYNAGDEGLFGLGGDEAVEGELAAGLGAELEEEAGAVAPVGVDYVDGAEPGGAVEVGGVGDGAERDLEFAGG